MLPADWGVGYDNVWLGISVVNQNEADRDVPRFLATNAAVRWLSMEPLLGPVSLLEGLGESLDWVVVGGESGPNARPMAAEWVSDIRDQCADRDVAFFFKQWGGTAKDKGGCQIDAREVKAWAASVCPRRAARARTRMRLTSAITGTLISGSRSG